MAEKTMQAFQAEIDAWVTGPGAGYWTAHENVARIAEEVGELARLVNHLYGPKPKKADEAKQEMGEELADIVFAVICLANSEGIDLGECLEAVMAKVWARDRDRYAPRDM
jgi:NTP pyrophosphatase (non-canonical NTP hydrolase)